MPHDPRPSARRDVVVPLERRRTERRDAGADALYSREVLELLRVCGAPLRAGDAAATAADRSVNERRTIDRSDAPG